MTTQSKRHPLKKARKKGYVAPSSYLMELLMTQFTGGVLHRRLPRASSSSEESCRIFSAQVGFYLPIGDFSKVLTISLLCYLQSSKARRSAANRQQNTIRAHNWHTEEGFRRGQGKWCGTIRTLLFMSTRSVLAILVHKLATSARYRKCVLHPIIKF